MKITKIILIAATALSACYFAISVYDSYYFKKSMKNTMTIMDRTSFTCSEGSPPKIERWGFLGYERYCERNNLKDGPWEAWEAQHLNIKGSYQHGLMHGEWIWFNMDGRPTDKVVYSQGNELSIGNDYSEVKTSTAGLNHLRALYHQQTAEERRICEEKEGNPG